MIESDQLLPADFQLTLVLYSVDLELAALDLHSIVLRVKLGLAAEAKAKATGQDKVLLEEPH